MMSVFNSKMHITTFKLLLYCLFCFLFLVIVGIPAIEGELNLEFYADSETYLEIAEDKSSTLEFILLIQPNVIGPVLILRALGSSYVLVFLMNALILIYFFRSIAASFELDRKILLQYILLSPILFVSMILINKEVISLLVIAFLFRYLDSKRIVFLLLSIIVSFFVRWQMALFVISVALFFGRLNIVRRYKVLSVLFFLVAVSAVYFFNKESFQNVNDVLEASKKTDNVSSSGIFYKLMDVQNGNPIGYASIFIFKALHLYAGIVSRYSYFFEWGGQMYTNVFVFSQGVMNLVVLFKVIKKRIKLSNIFLASAVIYAIVFSLSPIYSPRYLFPVYIMISCSLAVSNKESKDNSKEVQVKPS